MRYGRVQLALSTMAFYLAKLIVVAAMCAGPAAVAAADGAPGAQAGAELPRFVVICTALGARTLDTGAGKDAGIPGHDGASPDCPVCASGYCGTAIVLPAPVPATILPVIHAPHWSAPPQARRHGAKRTARYRPRAPPAPAI